MNPVRSASLLALALLLAPAVAAAKSSDRNQPMLIDAGYGTGSLEGNGTITYSSGVSIQQGTLDIRAERGDITMRDGEVTKVVFTGTPARLTQEMEDGSPMNATANRIEYDMAKDIVTFIGDYTVKSPKGSNSGQKMVYNLATGNMQSGGDGTRVRTVIQPRRPAPAATPQGEN